MWGDCFDCVALVGWFVAVLLSALILCRVVGGVVGFVLIVLVTPLLWSFDDMRVCWLFGVSYGSVGLSVVCCG